MAKKYALLSVSDKKNIVQIARGLVSYDYQIYATSGTAQILSDNKIPVNEISELTEFPECFSGRVKTLHPKVFGGLLMDKNKDEHRKDAEELGVAPFSILISNLYPFTSRVNSEKLGIEQAIELIDIGGVALIRAGAKNYRRVSVACDPNDYERILEELEKGSGKTTLKLREELAIKAFEHTSSYDQSIANYLSQSEDTFSGLSIHLPLQKRLRYGENPHQSASLYGDFDNSFIKIHGKELSYTNIIDISSATELISEFKRPALAIVKHTNPCGVGVDDDSLREAWEKAYATDKQSPFGGVIICNRPPSVDLARVLSGIFTEIIIAPEFPPQTRSILQKKKNCRLIVMRDNVDILLQKKKFRSVLGGALVQDADSNVKGLQDLEEKVVSKRPASRNEIEAMRFAWKVCKHVKSNAVVITGKDRTLGIGAGQMSRVDSARIAVWKAENAGLDIKGACAASDGMFPFPDGVEILGKAGVSCIIQPGGSLRDKEVIEACNKLKMSMAVTGYRHFVH